MSTDEPIDEVTAVDQVMAEVRRELVRRVALEDRDAHRAIYDELEHE